MHNRTFVGWTRSLVVIAGLVLMATSCTSAAEPDIESLGLAIKADIQAGTTFDAVVPVDRDTDITLIAAPPGVDATVERTSDGDSVMVSLAIDDDTPRGAYALALRVIQNGETYELGWPFEVVEPLG